MYIQRLQRLFSLLTLPAWAALIYRAIDFGGNAEWVMSKMDNIIPFLNSAWSIVLGVGWLAFLVAGGHTFLLKQLFPGSGTLVIGPHHKSPTTWQDTDPWHALHITATLLPTESRPVAEEQYDVHFLLYDISHGGAVRRVAGYVAPDERVPPFRLKGGHRNAISIPLIAKEKISGKVFVEDRHGYGDNSQLFLGHHYIIRLSVSGYRSEKIVFEQLYSTAKLEDYGAFDLVQLPVTVR